MSLVEIIFSYVLIFNDIFFTRGFVRITDNSQVKIDSSHNIETLTP